MANQKLEKVEGNVETCPSCLSKIYCRTKEASGNFPAKLQWQNEDKKAHYNYDFKTKAISCNIPLEEVEQEEVKVPKGHTIDDTNICAGIELFVKVKGKCKEFLMAQVNGREDFVNDMELGLMTKLIYQKLVK